MSSEKNTDKVQPSVGNLMSEDEIEAIGNAPETPESDVLSLVVDEDADALVIDNPNDEEMDFQEATNSSPANAGPPTAPTTPTQETPELAGNAASNEEKPSAVADEQMEAETTAEPAQAPAARVPPRNPMICTDARGTPGFFESAHQRNLERAAETQRGAARNRVRSTIVVPPPREREPSRQRQANGHMNGDQWLPQQPASSRPHRPRDESDFRYLQNIGQRQSHPQDFIKRFGCVRSELNAGQVRAWHLDLVRTLIRNVRARPAAYTVRKIKDVYRRINRLSAPPVSGDILNTAQFMASDEVVQLLRLVEQARAHNNTAGGSYNTGNAPAANIPNWIPTEVRENLLPPRDVDRRSTNQSSRMLSEARANRRWEEPQVQAQQDFREEPMPKSWADDEVNSPTSSDKKSPGSPRQEKRAATTSYAQAAERPAKRSSPPPPPRASTSAWNQNLATRVQSSWNRKPDASDSDSTVVPNRYAQQRERKLANKAARQQGLRDKELDEAANAPAARMVIRRKGHSFIAPELKDRHLAEMRPAKYTIQAGKWHWYFEEGDHCKEHSAEHSRNVEANLKSYLGIEAYTNEASTQLNQRHALESKLHKAGVRNLLPPKLFKVEAELFLKKIADKQRLCDDLDKVVRTPTKEAVDEFLTNVRNNLKVDVSTLGGFPLTALIMLVENMAYCLLSADDFLYALNFTKVKLFELVVDYAAAEGYTWSASATPNSPPRSLPTWGSKYDGEPLYRHMDYTG